MQTMIFGLNQSARDWLGLCIDFALMIGILMLWLTWHRNGKRQQRLEQLLAATAAQLDEATRHLAEATQSIQQLKSRQGQDTQRQDTAEKITHEKRKQRPAATMPVNNDSLRPPSRNSTEVSMILRMHREGETAETIAERLDMPLAQVKLTLKLHAASA